MLLRIRTGICISLLILVSLLVLDCESESEPTASTFTRPEPTATEPDAGPSALGIAERMKAVETKREELIPPVAVALDLESCVDTLVEVAEREETLLSALSIALTNGDKTSQKEAYDILGELLEMYAQMEQDLLVFCE